MKIKLIIFTLLFSFCSNEIVEKELIINNELFQDALELESKRNIEVNTEEYMIINYWASWCLECIEEHEILIQLANTKGLEDKVFLLSFQDSEENAKEFISKYGKGNITYVIDTKSKIAINSGVFGVPETHIIFKNKIIQKYIGPLTIEDFQEIINNFSKLNN